jgi:hypothetical protein
MMEIWVIGLYVKAKAEAKAKEMRLILASALAFDML